MLKTLKEFTSVAQAEVESLKLFYASVVSSLLFKFLYEVHNACISNFCCVQENNTLSYRVEMRMHWHYILERIPRSAHLNKVKFIGKLLFYFILF